MNDERNRKVLRRCPKTDSDGAELMSQM